MQRPDHLRTHQYATTANLDARIAIHRHYSTANASWFGWLFDRLPLASGQRVLDVGVGSGALWLEHRDRLPKNLRLTIADISPGMIASASTSLGPLVASAVVANAEDLPFDDASFDLVVANHMLYHVPDIDRAIGEFARVLAPGGRLVAATNGETHMIETWRLLADVTGREPDRRIATRFSLENGEQCLQRRFSHVEREAFPDSLHVTDPDAIVAYLASTAVEDALTDDHLEAAHAIVAGVVKRSGAFHVRKSAGVFVCRH